MGWVEQARKGLSRFGKWLGRGTVAYIENEFWLGLSGTLLMLGVTSWIAVQGGINAAGAEELLVLILAAGWIGSMTLMFHGVSLRPREEVKRKEREELAQAIAKELARTIADAIVLAFDERDKREKRDD